MHDTSGIVHSLGEKGYRLTPQRLMILAAMESSQDHISAELRHGAIFGLCEACRAKKSGREN